LSSLNESLSDLLECTVNSVKEVLHTPFDIEEPCAYNATTLQTEMSVLVGFTGEIQGRLIIDGHIPTFGKLGEKMFGMALEGEMLHSFVGELANMLAGNMCTSFSQKGRKVDITPPTIFMGEMKLFGFAKGISVPVAIHNVGEMKIILLLQEEKVV
jgi:chemotaxis protein CheX